MSQFDDDIQLSLVRVEPLAGIGELNPLSEPIIHERIDSRTTEFFAAARTSALDRYNPDLLSERARWRGIVLRVDGPPAQATAPHRVNPIGVLPSFIQNMYAGPLAGPPPALVSIRARIPELDASLPEPPTLDATDQVSQEIIEQYNVFTATQDISIIPPPQPGDIVYLDFMDRRNQADGIFLGSVSPSGQTFNASVPVSPMAAFGSPNAPGTGPWNPGAGPCTPLAAAAPSGDVAAPNSTPDPGSQIPTATPVPSVGVACAARLGPWADLGLNFHSDIPTCSTEQVVPKSRGDIINQLIVVGDSSGNEYEVIPNSLLDTIVVSGEWGILTLFIAVANWGVEWCSEPPADPAGRNWGGPRSRSGKHLRDYLAGGLGIPHIDSSFLRRDTYGRWGRPPGIPNEVLDDFSFDQIRQSRYRDAWRAWARPLVQSREFLHWTIHRWLEKYWDPADQTNNTIATKSLNARIRNSVSGVGRRLTGQSWESQAQGYVAYKLRRRGQSAAERTMRQVNFCRRVLLIAQSYGFE